MAYTEDASVTLPQPAPEVAYWVRFGQDILFSEIFNGVPQLYAGSSFTVEEIYEVELEVTDETLIDVDFKWVPPKKYLGTWRISDTLPSDGISSEDEGFINNETIKIKRYSTYVIQANADVPVAEFESGAIDNCNFMLNEVGVEIPPFAGSINTLATNDAVFKFRNTLQRAPLIDRVFIPKIRFIGIYTNPGCQVIAGKYTARIINAISVDLPPFPTTVCTLPGGTVETCETLFQEFIDTNAGQPPPQVRFVTQALAQAAYPGVPLAPAPNPPYIANYSWLCSLDGVTTYQYWVAIGV